MGLLGDLTDQNDYSHIGTGYYVHRIKEDEENIEVVAVDHFNKLAILPEGKTMRLIELNEGWVPVNNFFDALPDGLPGADNSGPKSKLLGDIESVYAEPEQIQQVQSPVAMPALSNDIENYAKQAFNFEEDKTDRAVVIDLSPEEMMISNAIKLSANKKSTININASLEVNFDIEKIKTIAETMQIDPSVTVKTLINSEFGEEVVKTILEYYFHNK